MEISCPSGVMRHQTRNFLFEIDLSRIPSKIMKIFSKWRQKWTQWYKISLRTEFWPDGKIFFDDPFFSNSSNILNLSYVKLCHLNKLRFMWKLVYIQTQASWKRIWTLKMSPGHPKFFWNFYLSPLLKNHTVLYFGT